ncbi:MAG: hypothetical protein NTV20_02155 [Candidatus Shapirobacteria bacterium]|nr:hypothetical protein [Candidatus Shapirobacteria bacterium]
MTFIFTPTYNVTMTPETIKSEEGRNSNHREFLDNLKISFHAYRQFCSRTGPFLTEFVSLSSKTTTENTMPSPILVIKEEIKSRLELAKLIDDYPRKKEGYIYLQDPKNPKILFVLRETMEEQNKHYILITVLENSRFLVR